MGAARPLDAARQRAARDSASALERPTYDTEQVAERARREAEARQADRMLRDQETRLYQAKVAKERKTEAALQFVVVGGVILGVWLWVTRSK